MHNHCYNGTTKPYLQSWRIIEHRLTLPSQFAASLWQSKGIIYSMRGNNLAILTYLTVQLSPNSSFDTAADMCLQNGVFGVGATVQVMMKL